MIPIHASVLPDGRVVTFGTTLTGVQTAMFDYDIWDSFAGTGEDSHLTLSNQTATDIFCGSNLVLPLTGNLLVNGGDNYSTGTRRSTNTPTRDATLLVASSNTLERAGVMQRPRWYGSAITLPNGETYLQGGSGISTKIDLGALRNLGKNIKVARAVLEFQLDPSKLNNLYRKNYYLTLAEADARNQQKRNSSNQLTYLFNGQSDVVMGDYYVLSDTSTYLNVDITNYVQRQMFKGELNKQLLLLPGAVTSSGAGILSNDNLSRLVFLKPRLLLYYNRY